MSLAVVLPGRAYAVTMPALAVVVDAVTTHGYDARPVDWGLLAELPDDPGTFVVEHLGDALGDDRCDLVVAKSMGTLAAPYAAERGWPAIWVTPLLRDAVVAAAIRTNPAPQLLVCGRADPFHAPDVAADLTCDVLELPGVDHALSDTGDAVVAPDILGQVADATADFLRRMA